jgi:glucose/mannose-6-phosphate isomerase
MHLDDLDAMRALDADDMLGHVDALPDQLADAWALGQTLDLPAGPGAVEQIVICGMGGSAISGDLLAALSAGSCHVPITVNRGYDLPSYVGGPETLVVALSFSGSTEETLSCARQAAERDAYLLAITTGGTLAALAEELGGVVWTFEYAAQPRAALGWLYGLLLAAMTRLHLVDERVTGVDEAVDVLRAGRDRLGADVPTAENPAKQLAADLAGRLPFIWGSGLLWPVARRWKTQLNENAKHAASADEMPELNHNSVVGLSYPPDLAESLAVVSLVSAAYDHPRVGIRQRVTAALVERESIPFRQVEARGEGRLAAQMSLIQHGDYVSYYLAMLNEVDPTPIPNIVWLKEQLAGADG